MATIVEYIIQLKEDLSAGLTKADGKVKKLDSSANTLKGTIQKLGIAFGAMEAFRMGSDILKLASDLEETESKFGVVFSNIEKDANNMSKNLQDNFDLSALSAKQLLSDTGDLLTGFGFGQKMALDLSGSVQELAIDLASFTNFAGGAEGASKALTKALLGERESVKALGISILESDVKAKVKSLRASGQIVGMSERQAKAYATLQIAISQSKNALGDYSRTKEGDANVTRAMKEDTIDFATTLGKEYLPKLTELKQSLRAVIKWGTKNIDIIKKGIGWVVKIGKAFLYYKIGIFAATKAIKLAAWGNKIYRLSLVAINRGLKSSVLGLKAFKGALIKTGVGALAIGVGFLIEKLISWTDKTDEQTAAQDELNTSLKKTEELIGQKQYRSWLKEITGGITKLADVGGKKVEIFDIPSAAKVLEKFKTELPQFNQTTLSNFETFFSSEIVRLKRGLGDASGLIKQMTLSNIAQYKDQLTLVRSELKRIDDLKPNTVDGTVTESISKTVTGAAPKIFNINFDNGVKIDNFNNTSTSGMNSLEDLEAQFVAMLQKALVKTQISVG